MMADSRVLTDVSRETLAQYVAMIRQWTARINLVASSSTEDIWTRHINDSARLAALCPNDDGTYLDLGSGAGLPGVVTAILRPSLHATLIESDQRKATFLRAVRRELGLTYNVITDRIEDAEPQRASTISARALAPLTSLLNLAVPHARQDTTFLFLKGQAWRDEVHQAEIDWRFECDPVYNDNNSGPVLVVRNVEAKQ
ncbi:16S rRNA (guanine(527)-N(7))-methyltransferase RsmG [Jannaschia sp.]|nr:16S rRNA (guanine(527)-N(7))-methyltransferase RsmG [Jannaschia sp.]